MSWQLVLLNRYLRWVERPALARQPIDRLRRCFEFKAKIHFHGPRGRIYRRDAVAGVPVQWVQAHDVGEGPVILYLHGGAYVFGSSDSHRAMLAAFSALTGRVACLPDYRLAPEHPFPAPIEDALACYRVLRARGEVILGGDSAGGGLALALLHEILRQGLERPLGLFAFSPLTDMTFSGASVRDNEGRDTLLSARRIGEVLADYLGGHDAADPRASPLFGAFAGAPPVWLSVGDTEILRDDALRMQDALVRQGVRSVLHVRPDHPHVWPMFHNILPEAGATLRDLAGWIRSL